MGGTRRGDERCDVALVVKRADRRRPLPSLYVETGGQAGRQTSRRAVRALAASHQRQSRRDPGGGEEEEKDRGSPRQAQEMCKKTQTWCRTYIFKFMVPFISMANLQQPSSV